MSGPQQFVNACRIVERSRPDLAREFTALGSVPFGEFAKWLDEHLPIAGGWGRRSPKDLEHDLESVLGLSE